MNRTLLALVSLTLLAACGGPTAAECASNTDTDANYGQAFVTTNCRSCHQHTSQYGTQAAVQGSLTSLESELSTGRMPQGLTLTAAERARVITWLGCGAP